MAISFRYGGKDLTLLQYLEERVRKNPGSSFFAMLSYFYLEIDKVGEALSVAQRGVIVHPNYSTGHVVLAMAMMRAGLFTDAKKELLKAKDLHPDSKIIERIAAELEKQEQADTIGRKLAEEFRKSTSSETDIMKTVEESLEANRIKGSNEDLLIPGLDAIIGEDSSPQADSAGSRLALSPDTAVKKSEEGTGAEKGMPTPRESGSSIAKAIIEKVTRELERKNVSDEGGDVSGQSGAEEIQSGGEGFDFDVLARELESGAPIRPTEDSSLNREDDSGIELTPEIVTDTLALIFEQQGQIKTAIEAYNILMKKKPEQIDFYREKIAELKLRFDASH